MRTEEEAQREFGAAYPHLFTVACEVITRFYRFDTAAVEDAVAETMARTFEAWKRVRTHDNPAEWVVVCAKNVCLDQLRANVKRGERARKAAAASETPVVLPKAASATIWKALENLSKRHRDVAVLRYLMDCDEAMTASTLGMTLADVRLTAHETRDRLRLRVGDVYIGDATA